MIRKLICFFTDHTLGPVELYEDTRGRYYILSTCTACGALVKVRKE